MTGLVIIVLVAVGVILAVLSLLLDTGFLDVCARVERDLHAARRSREVNELARIIRNDATRLRRELRDELREYS